MCRDRQILGPTDSAFVSDQSVFPQDKNGNSIEFSRNFAGECFFAANAADACEQINSGRSTSELD